jgi:hypothetical protein
MQSRGWGLSQASLKAGVVAITHQQWVGDCKSWVPRNNDVIILKDILPVTESCIVGVSGANLLPAWCLLLTDPSWHDCRG